MSSILSSNSNLRHLVLPEVALPFDDYGSTFQVPLRELNTLSLRGDFRRLFVLLRRLVLPESLDSIFIDGLYCTVEDILPILGPYMRNHFQRDPRFQDRLAGLFFLLSQFDRDLGQSRMQPRYYSGTQATVC